MKQTDDVQLRPCRFCGGKAVMGSGFVEDRLGDLWVVAIWCTTCDAFLVRKVTVGELLRSVNSSIVKKIVRDYAIEAWNNEEGRTGGGLE